MSESDEHRDLVRAMSEQLSTDPGIRLHVDLLPSHGWGGREKIGGYYPDVYGIHAKTGVEHICEAKTYRDLETCHSRKQIRSFVFHLNQKAHGTFTLGAYGMASERAKTILRFLAMDTGFHAPVFQVFDGRDYWRLDFGGQKTWRLL